MLSNLQSTRNVTEKNKQKTNTFRKQDDGTKADILDFFFLFFLSIFLLTLVKLP